MNKNTITIKGNHIASVEVINNEGKIIQWVSLKDANNPTLTVGSLIKPRLRNRLVAKLTNTKKTSF